MMPYDVGAITRDLQSAFRLFIGVPAPTRPAVIELELEDAEGTATNLATPANIAVLLRALRRLTDDIAKARSELSDLIPDAGLLAWNLGWIGWRSRLARYEAEVAKAPVGDRADILWTVTAPLLLGFFGGENSTDPQKPIDAITPFSLANQLQIAEEWRAERLRLFNADLKQAFKDAASIGSGALVVAAVIVGLLLFARSRR